MLFALVPAHHSSDNQRQLRRWFLDNGLVSSSIVEPALVDSVAGTVTVTRRVAVPGQEDEDFPEFLTGGDDQPITVEDVLPLAVPPLAWMLTMTGAWDVTATRPSRGGHLARVVQ